jgi:hypothetical protein
MTKDYQQPSAKSTETHSEENYHNLQDYKCGDYENGKSDAEFTHQLTETLHKQCQN